MASAVRTVFALSTTALLERLAQKPDRFPGSLLLTGRSESRLDAESRHLAALLLCPGNDPEGRCGSCRRVVSALHPDLLVVEPDGVQIRIDRVREAVAFGAGRPYEGSRRVAIVRRAELLGLEAGNALLKPLEEPGRHFHWILTTTRAETLLPTICSRCAVATVPSAPHAQRVATWRSRGFSEEDALDLALLAPEMEEETAARLDDYRRWRTEILEALEAGLIGRDVAALLLLAEDLARAEPERARLLTQLLADAAVAASVSTDLLRHRPVAGTIRELARRLAPEGLRRAALRSAELPADSRRGNRRLHYEQMLIGLYLTRDEG